ncbi:MAG: hypothetical protein IPF53_15750 [Blastocatellia bacterium]|nr:hypothetical protein [Blastocatellia bacterium]
MRFGSQLISAALVLLCAVALVTAQVAGPADKTAPRIEKVSPDVIAVSTAAVDVTLNGRLFEKEAVVRRARKARRVPVSISRQRSTAPRSCVCRCRPHWSPSQECSSCA